MRLGRCRWLLPAIGCRSLCRRRLGLRGGGHVSGGGPVRVDVDGVGVGVGVVG